MRDGKVAGFIHLFSVHQGKGESLETSVDMHEIEGSCGSGLSDEDDVSGDKVGSANLVDVDGGLKVVSFCKEAIKGVGELGGEDYCFPFGMVSGGIEVGHGVVESFAEVGVR